MLPVVLCELLLLANVSVAVVMCTIFLKDHFEEDQFEGRRADGRRLLKWNAVPTLTAFEIAWRRSLIALEPDNGL